jgi:hypothetical protein
MPQRMHARVLGLAVGGEHARTLDRRDQAPPHQITVSDDGAGRRGEG